MREDITKALASVREATAKQIAACIGADQLETVKEMNRMLSEGLVERAKKPGGGNEYTWWLASTVDAKPEIEPPRPAAIASEIRALAEEHDEPEFREVDAPLSELLALLDVNAAQTSTPVRDAIARLSAQKESQSRLDDNYARLVAANEKLRTNNAQLELKIDDLTLVDAEFKPNLVFVTVGRNSAAKRHPTLEKAQRRASALVRSEKETEVLVLEPVGRVVRGSEWRTV